MNMRRSLLLTLFLIPLVSVVSAQRVAIQNDRQNIFYIGIPNRITVIVKKVKNKRIVVKTDQGTIIKKEDHQYELMFNTEGNTKLEVFTKRGHKRKKVYEGIFRVKRLPDPTAKIGVKKKGDKISKAGFQAHIGIVPVLEGFGLEAVYRVTGFYMTVIRDGKPIFGHTNEGGKFDDTIKDFEEKLTSGDILVFSGIKCITPDRSERHLAALELTIE